MRFAHLISFHLILSNQIKLPRYFRELNNDTLYFHLQKHGADITNFSETIQVLIVGGLVSPDG